MMQVFAFKTVINHFTFAVDKLRYRCVRSFSINIFKFLKKCCFVTNDCS